MKNEQFDSIIDEVAGAMTAGEPRRAFAAEVMARIASGDAPRRTWRAAWAMAPLAAAAAIVLALVVARGAHRGADHARPQEPTSAARGVQPGDRGPEIAASRKPGDAARDTPRIALATTAAPRNTHGRAIDNAARGAASGIDRLVAPSLDVAPLAVGALSQEPIRIDQLDAITPIGVTPLGIDDMQRRHE